MTTKRRALSGLLDTPDQPPPMPVRPPAPRTPEVRSPEVRTPDQQTPEVRSTGVRKPKARQAPRPAQAASPGPDTELPKYKRLERKELLMWPDQITELSLLARMLNRNREGAGERITPNTLIRVGVAVVLAHRSELAGTTEEELLRSLGL